MTVRTRYMMVKTICMDLKVIWRPFTCCLPLVTCFVLPDLVDDKEAAVRLLTVNAPQSRLSSNFTQVFRPITNGLIMRATAHIWFDSFGRRQEARTAQSGSWSRFTAEPFAVAYWHIATQTVLALEL